MPFAADLLQALNFNGALKKSASSGDYSFLQTEAVAGAGTGAEA